MTASRKSPATNSATLSRKSTTRPSTERFPLSWSHYVLLVRRARTDAARAFYETESFRGGWTVRQLERQIASQFYERTALSKNKTAMLRKGAVAKRADAMNPEEEIRDPFVLEFLGSKTSTRRPIWRKRSSQNSRRSCCRFRWVRSGGR